MSPRTGHSDHRPRDGWPLARVALVGLIAVAGVVLFVSHPPNDLLASPFASDTPADSAAMTSLSSAFGMSGEVRLQLRLPGERFDFPMQRSSASGPVLYQWVKAADSSIVSAETTLDGTSVEAPARPGFYRLQLLASAGRVSIDSLLVGVMVPFAAKMGATLNGYQIGKYKGERAGADAAAPPRGFVELFPENVELPVSTHFRLADFLTHDAQEVWPRYVALDPRILDKVELVLRYLGSRDHDIPMDVHSGFRTPLHNRRVPRAASDSRHQYGDAADLAIDANGDGRVSYLDGLAVAHAVELVERDHPELAGGLGLYGNRGAGAYVHIDVRGATKRWRG